MSTTPVSKPQTAVSTWTLDPVHSVAEFKVKHMMISNVKGQFTGISGVLTFDETDIGNSRVEASIDASSINTSDPQRDAHLKSADFFEAEKLPGADVPIDERQAHWRGRTGGHRRSDDSRRHTASHLPGGRSDRGRNKDPWGKTRVGLSATTKINRKDFGLTWNAALETGGILVGEEVTITLDVQFVKA